MSGIEINRADLGLRANVTCPYCWADYPPEDVKWISESSELLGDPKLGEQFQRRFLPSQFNVAGNAVDANNHDCHKLACPNCHLSIPRSLLQLPPLFISVIGTPGSGKTYFLTSMVHQLKQNLPRLFRVSFADSSPETNLILNDYIEQQFLNPNGDKLVKLAKTQEFGDGFGYKQVKIGSNVIQLPQPFLFNVRTVDGHMRHGSMDSNARIICVYDNAGESFLPGQDNSDSPVTRHMAHADMLLFLFDPSQSHAFRHSLMGKTNDLQVTNAMSTSQQDVTLNEAAYRIKTYKGIHEDQKIKTPLVVIVNKYDVWKPLLDEPLPPVALRVADESSRVFNHRAVKEYSDLVRDLLFQHSPEFVSVAESVSETVYYVPVSSTGCSPEKDSTGNLSHRPSSLTPIWTEVPLIMALTHSCQIIPYRK